MKLILTSILIFNYFWIMPVQAQDEFTVKEISKEKWDVIRMKIINTNGILIVDEGLIYRIDASNEMAVYFLTKSNHSAHPAIIKRFIVTEGSDITLKTQAWIAGPRKEFEEWLEAFISQDIKIINEIN